MRRRNQTFWLLVFCVFLVASSLVYLYFRSKYSSILSYSSTRYFPTAYSTITGVHWYEYSFQPFIKNIVKESNGTRYFELAYRNKRNEFKTAKVIIHGQINNNDKITLLYKSNQSQRAQKISDSTSEFKIGQQIKVTFLVPMTSDRSEETNFCAQAKDYCIIGAFADTKRQELIQFITDHTAVDNFLLPAYLVSNEVETN